MPEMWTDYSDFSEEHSVEIKATAPAGYVLRIEQAIGHCDGNEAKTEMFRITHTNAEGIVVEEKYQKMFRNGTIVTLDKWKIINK